MRILKTMGWTRQYWLSLPQSEQDFWLANDRYEQRHIKRLQKAPFMVSDEGSTHDSHAWLALILAQM